MELCECERRFETIDAINQHITATKRKGPHRHLSKEEQEFRRKEMLVKAAKEFEELSILLFKKSTS